MGGIVSALLLGRIAGLRDGGLNYGGIFGVTYSGSQHSFNPINFYKHQSDIVLGSLTPGEETQFALHGIQNIAGGRMGVFSNNFTKAGLAEHLPFPV